MSRMTIRRALVGDKSSTCLRGLVWLMTFSFLAAAEGADSEGAGFDHSALNRVLSTHVDSSGKVDYARLKVEPADLDAYVDQLAAISPESHPDRFPDRAHRLAYWINAYNGFVLKGVVDAYPVKSVKDIKFLSGFFNRTWFTAGGEEYTLNEIEHGILRERFQEPRIHAAINCASVGCPRLPQEIFRPEDLEQQLERGMQFFVGEERNVKLDPGTNTIYLSSIFDWFEDDFTGWVERKHGVDDARITDYLVLYLEPNERLYLEEHPEIRMEHLKYDWALNDKGR